MTTNLPLSAIDTTPRLLASVNRVADRHGIPRERAHDIVRTTYAAHNGRITADVDLDPVTNDLIVAGASVVCDECDTATDTGYVHPGYPRGFYPEYCSETCADAANDRAVDRLP